MSPLLEKVLAEVDRLDSNEQLKLISHLIEGLRQKSDPSPKASFSRKNLFGCMRGQIAIAPDFNAPLNDLQSTWNEAAKSNLVLDCKRFENLNGSGI